MHSETAFISTAVDLITNPAFRKGLVTRLASANMSVLFNSTEAAYYPKVFRALIERGRTGGRDPGANSSFSWEECIATESKKRLDVRADPLVCTVHVRMFVCVSAQAMQARAIRVNNIEHHGDGSVPELTTINIKAAHGLAELECVSRNASGVLHPFFSLENDLGGPKREGEPIVLVGLPS